MTKTEENGPSKEREENVQAWGLLTAASVKVYNLQICESEDLQVKCGETTQMSKIDRNMPREYSLCTRVTEYAQVTYTVSFIR